MKRKGCGIQEDTRAATGGLCCLNKLWLVWQPTQSSDTPGALQVGVCCPLDLSLNVIPSRKKGAIHSYAHCTHLGYANCHIEMTDLNVFMTIFQPLAVKHFEERAALFLIHKRAIWSASDPAEKPFLT